jgi:hypothetical protein
VILQLYVSFEQVSEFKNFGLNQKTKVKGEKVNIAAA